MSGGRPPLIDHQFYVPKNTKINIKSKKQYKNWGVQISQKSKVNQPNQGHQPWQGAYFGRIFCLKKPSKNQKNEIAPSEL